jgi:hypothetical protein
MAQAPASITTKDEFTNTTDGWLGVVQIDHMGAARGASVSPGGSVFLTEEEQILTANAPVNDEDNPFINGALALRTRARRDPQPTAVRRAPRRRRGPPEETGATPQPEGDPPSSAPPPPARRSPPPRPPRSPRMRSKRG